MNFELLENLSLEEKDIQLFKKLNGNPDFTRFKDFVENTIHLKTHALVVGTLQDGVDKLEYLTELRGFARNWKSITAKIKEHGKE